MSIIAAPHAADLQTVVDAILAGVVVRPARMEPEKRYKIDARDAARRVIYLNHARSSADLVAGLFDACERIRRLDRERARAALTVIEGDSVGGDVEARPSLRVLAGG